ncbi:ABC transporter permease [Actinoplanes sp. NPDC051851]|uniref:ABC transporter permease n=1 Tax=Actinoplanes sp. NPDC051851 TaxID=3154753 RepID=UPI00343378C2
MRTLRRVRAFAGQFALLGALALLAAFLVSGPVRYADERTDTGLRGDIAALGSSARDLTFVTRKRIGVTSGVTAQDRLGEIRADLAEPLPRLVGDAWYIAGSEKSDIGYAGKAPATCPDQADLRYESGIDEAVQVTEGRAPQSRSTAEVMVRTDQAAAAGLAVGDRLTLTGRYGATELTLVGLFTARDAAAPIWADQQSAQVACPDPLEGLRYQITLLTDQSGAAVAGARLGDLDDHFRYRLDERRLTAADVNVLTTAVARARRTPPDGTVLQSSLDLTLAEFDQQVRGVEALLAVVRAGILATVAGLILLAAGLAADRRRAEFTLLRARGAAVRTVFARTLRESLLVVPPAVAAGWLAGTRVPGRPDTLEPLLVAGAAVLATLAVPVFAAYGARRPAFSGHRADAAAIRPSARRLTAEGFLVLLAAGGLYLLRRRGLDTGAGVDPYLIIAPILAALAVSILALRIVPFVLRGAGRLAARARGAVAFLGLAGAGRGAPLRSGPLAVLVVAIATGLFTGTVTSTVDHARDRAAELTVPADALVTGHYFTGDAAERVAGVPGVTGAATMTLEPGSSIRADDRVTIVQALAMVVDATTPGLDLPVALSGADRGDVVPAVVSPEVAAELGGGGSVSLQGRSYAFRVAAVRDQVAGLPAGTRRFVVLPRQAMVIPDYQPLVPNRILVRGAGFDEARVRTVADESQRDQLASVSGHPVEQWQLTLPATVTTRAAYRASLEERGVYGALSFTFTAGLAAAAALALGAVALSVLAGAPARGRILSLLRTLGLSGGQGRGLLIFEIVPMIGVAVLAGALVGIGLPELIGPALGLDGFTAGVTAGTTLDPRFAGGVPALAVLAVAAALVVENVANRRLRLGTVLRVGEEQ